MSTVYSTDRHSEEEARASRLPSPVRLAFIVSHPIQYYAPLYQRLAKRDDVVIKVFFTWHSGERPVHDAGFATPVAWDIPVTQGYDFEFVPNASRHPGTQHFLGLRNPTLVERVLAWQPDVVHVTGWAWHSHLMAMRALHKRGVPVLFRGDSHLLDRPQQGAAWWLKRALLSRVFSWPHGFLVVGRANREYYEAFGVREDRLYRCPHSIDVGRFAEPNDALETEAARWQQELSIEPDQCVVLFAGKFETKKRPIELMRAVHEMTDRRIVLVMVGSGELEAEIRAFARVDSSRFRVLPFQNQSRMPVVYRLGDLFVLPSAFDETWGLAVNEALACGRPVLVSTAVGGAPDVVDRACGRVFSWSDPSSLKKTLHEMTSDLTALRNMREAARARSRYFDLAETEAAILSAIYRVCGRIFHAD